MGYKVIERRTVQDIGKAMQKYEVTVLGPLTKAGPMWFQPFMGELKEPQEPEKPKEPAKSKEPAKAKEPAKSKDKEDSGVIEGFVPDDMK